jgi:hypothetical protein
MLNVPRLEDWCTINLAELLIVLLSFYPSPDYGNLSDEAKTLIAPHRILPAQDPKPSNQEHRAGMSLSTQSPDNPRKTPSGNKKEDYEDYDLLSPPNVPDAKWRTFDEAVTAINNDFKEELRVEWKDVETGRAVVWFRRRDNVELPSDLSLILLFLCCRNFKMNVNMAARIAAVKNILNNGAIRRIILQVMKCTGDHSLSHDDSYQRQYIRACLTIHRYFQQPGTTGFVPDMSSPTYYLRMQKFGSCFLQAPCVAMSYLLHAHGKPMPPANASRLIRHHFDDDQLIQYVNDFGGDSVAIFKILERKFFECQAYNRDPVPFICRLLSGADYYQSVLGLLREGPGLVSKFPGPDIFECSPPSCELKKTWPKLARYENWSEIPAHLIPPGVARFEKWNELAKFIPFDAPSDAGLEEKEDDLKKWTALLFQSAETEDEGQSSTTVTASISAVSGSSFADNEISLGTPCEKSPASIPSRFSFTRSEDSDEEDWSHFLDNDHADDDVSCASYEDHNVPGEGSASPPARNGSSWASSGRVLGVLAPTELLGRPHAAPRSQR